jgi:hypothetical protein
LFPQLIIPVAQTVGKSNSKPSIYKHSHQISNLYSDNLNSPRGLMRQKLSQLSFLKQDHKTNDPFEVQKTS